MKFKVGDVCVVQDARSCGTFESCGGDSIRITEVNDGYYYEILKDGKVINNCERCLGDGDLILASGKKEKVLPVQYVVIYDEVDGDPAKTFTSKKELNKWLKEAKDDENVVFSSIKVFEVKREYEVRTSFTLKKKS